MTERQYRVRIRVHDVELELEGPEEFLERHRSQWEPLLDMLPDLARGNALAGWDDAEERAHAEAPSTPGAAAPARSGGGDLFADFRPSLTDYDKVLIACYHVQQQSEDHAFRWPDASRVAVAHGIPAPDAAAEFQYLLDIRHVMRVKRGMYRVSAKGVEAIHRLMTIAPNAP